jgi:hypothetical protein
MSPQTHKSRKRKNNQQPRRPALRGKRYAIISCPFCDASIYKRHLSAHVQEFHADRSGPQTIRQSSVGIGGIEIADLSPELQEEIKKRYLIDESGFMISYENWENEQSIVEDSEEEMHEG